MEPLFPFYHTADAAVILVYEILVSPRSHHGNVEKTAQNRQRWWSTGGLSIQKKKQSCERVASDSRIAEFRILRRIVWEHVLVSVVYQSNGGPTLSFIHKWDKRDDPRMLTQDPHLPLRLRSSGSAYSPEWAGESLGKVMMRSHWVFARPQARFQTFLRYLINEGYVQLG